MTPNFFIVGVQKGGTSTLALWLRDHPEVFLSARKELHYFCSCPDEDLPAAATDEEYLDHFARARPYVRAVGEASPCYLYYPDALEQIERRFPSSRFVVSLRDPVERFFSHYLMNEIYRPTHRPAEALLHDNLAGRLGTNALDDLVGVGMYASQLDRLFQIVEPSRVHVTFLDHIADNGPQEVTAIEDHLGLSHHPVDTTARDKVYVEPKNVAGRIALRNPVVRELGVRILPSRVRHHLRTRWLGSADLKPEMSQDLRSRLRQVYADDTSRLERLLGTPVPWSWHR